MKKIEIPESMRLASVWAVWAFLAFGALGWALFVVLRAFDAVKDAAAWVQAIGSIAAIWGAFSLSNSQVKRQERQQQLISEQKSKALFAVVKHAVDHARTVRKSTLADDGNQDFKLAWNTGYSEIFKSALKSLSLIPVHELGEYKLVIAHNHILAAMINISHKVERYVSAESFIDQEFAAFRLEVWGLTEMINHYWPAFEGDQ